MTNEIETPADKIRSKSFLSSVRSGLGFTMDRVHEMNVQEVASSMALATVLAIVPVLALSLAVFAAFPSFAESRSALEELITTSFLPAQYSQILIKYLKEFAEHAAGLTTFGVIGLAVTVFLLIDKLFRTINNIFKSPETRTMPQKVLIYWALMTVGPIMMAASLTMTGKAAALAFQGLDKGIVVWLYPISQFVMQGFFFAVLYKFIPCCRVRFSHALVGGMLVALLGQIVKEAFEYYVMRGTMSNIYGAFVALPVLVLWMYGAWYLFFAGAAVTATLPKITSGRYLDSYRKGDDFLTGLLMLKHLVSLRLSGDAPAMTVKALCDAADTYPEVANRILYTLRRAGYVAQVAEQHKDEAWVLVADSQRTSLLGVFEAFCVDGNNSILGARVEGKVASGELAQWWETFKRNEMLNQPLAKIFEDPDLLGAVKAGMSVPRATAAQEQA
jgi:membrane protein